MFHENSPILNDPVTNIEHLQKYLEASCIFTMQKQKITEYVNMLIAFFHVF